MNRQVPTAPLVLLGVALGLGVGYVLGHREDRSRESGPGDVPTNTLAYISSLQAKVASLEQQLHARSMQLEVPADMARREVPATGGRSSPEAGPPTAAPEVPDPGRAAEVLRQIRAALVDADGTTLEQLAPAIAAQGALLAPDLAALLESADSLYEMEHLAELLGLAADPQGVDSLTRLLERDTSDAVRTAAIRALGQIRDPRAVGPLQAEFTRTGGSPMAPSLAATALGSIGTPEAVSALRTEILQGQNRMVRTFALRALAELRRPALGGFFLEQATREGASDRYRVEAIAALGGTGDRTRISALERVAFSPEWSRAIQEAAKHALNRLLGEVRYPVR